VSLRALREGPGRTLEVIDQTKLPFALEWRTLRTSEETADAIRTMVVRGAPLIGIAGAYGLALGLRNGDALDACYALLKSTRPTAVNLAWALDRVRAAVSPLPPAQRFDRAWSEAQAIAAAESEACRRIGAAGRPLFEKAKNVLTHCNAGWLATGDWGTALAPVYAAHKAGQRLHVWVDETRPRNQGTLTAWELAEGGVPHTLIADNAGGLLMQRGQVDACIVGADRIAANGDVCNKVGTYLKALAAKDAGIPFYVAAPVSTVDPTLPTGAEIPIEERSGDEVRTWNGVKLMPGETAVANPAFDVTPARLVTAIITERGVVPATREGIERLFR
jgi:methylthioribose-1-phosphate isomerase